MAYPANESLSAELVRPWLPGLEPNRNKYSAGQMMLLGGEPGMEGAAWLAASAALRSGAGMVRWVHAELTPPPPATPEVVQMSVLAGNDRHLDVRPVMQELGRTRCLLVGVGTSSQPPPAWKVETIQAAQERRIPIVWDGGALHWLKEGWVAPQAGDCLTPHAGELQVLCGQAVHDRQRAALDLAHRWESVVVAKGPVTMICASDRPTLVSHHGDPGMASAGTGDVLAGIIAGLVAQGLLAWQAAGLGVWLHSRTGKLAADAETSYCLTASSLIQELPAAFRDLLAIPEVR
jgi:hydroxyethylthiazole kinase-like uncharacterized protein yjeF